MIVKFIKLHIKQIASTLFFFVVLVCCLFWKNVPFPGEDAEPLYQYSWPEKLTICEIEGKKIYRESDSLSISLLHLFLHGSRDVFYTHHLLYKNTRGEEKKFLTYRTPFVFGIDVMPEDIRLAIEDEKEKIVIYYEEEPVGGISIDYNPFPKIIELKLETDLDQILKKDGVCK